MNHPKLGRLMMSIASAGDISDDVYFNSLCRVGEVLTTLGLPFYETKFSEMKADDQEFAKEFVRNNVALVRAKCY
jgi:hypothetical protein